MRALAIIGWSGSGKTTLLTALIPHLRDHGLRVSSIKRAHHHLVLDQPGKDSHRHAQAGAEEVILAGASGFALFSRHHQDDLPGLLARLAPVDLVLVEGFKESAVPVLEVYRPSLGQPPLWQNQPVLAVASDTALRDCPAPVLDLADPAAIAVFLIETLGLDTYRTKE